MNIAFGTVSFGRGKLTLIQIRPCDGYCCMEAPRFPNAEKTDCIYHDTSGGKENGGCMLMRGAAAVPVDGAVPYKGLSTADTYQQTCVLWPQKNSEQEIGDTGGCCWQLVEQ